jgi:hypothetical protein
MGVDSGGERHAHVTNKGASTGGCRARQDGEVFARTDGYRFISAMTELAVTFTVNSTEIGECVTGNCLSEAEERKSMISIDSLGRKDSSSNSNSHNYSISQD